MRASYRPKTSRSYSTQFSNFLRFCDVVGESYEHVSPVLVLSFIEYLILNGLSHGSIQNYLSGVKQCFKMYNLPVDAFEHEWIRMSLRNVSRSIFSPMKIKGVFTVSQVQEIVKVISSLPYGEV